MNLRHGQIEKVLKFVSVESPAPVIKEQARWLRTPVSFKLDHEQIQRLTRQRIVEWQEVQAYIDTSACLMTELARALDDPTAQPCGTCANCLGRPVFRIVRFGTEGARGDVPAPRRVPTGVQQARAAKRLSALRFQRQSPAGVEGRDWARPVHMG